MSDKTAIEWTDATWNPVRGCSRVSEGCRNCYAERVAHRFSGPGQPYEGLTTKGKWNGTMRVVEEHMHDPLRWKRPRRIFVNSMSDLFHPNLFDGDIARVFRVMRENMRHTYQVLTKRPERAAQFARDTPYFEWPDHVWIGTSVECQDTADGRIPHLLEIPAAVRFLSVEPLLGPIQFPLPCRGSVFWTSLDWVIVGGESGPGARPMDPAWVRSIRDQCVDAGVPFFFKQWGGVHKRDAGRVLDGETWGQFPVT